MCRLFYFTNSFFHRGDDPCGYEILAAGKNLLALYDLPEFFLHRV